MTELNYYSARLFCWIAQRKVDTDASVLTSLKLIIVYIWNLCCSCIHIICYNMTSTICEAASCLYTVSSELVTAKSTHFLIRHYFCSKQTKTPNKSLSYPLRRQVKKSSFQVTKINKHQKLKHENTNKTTCEHA